MVLNPTPQENNENFDWDSLLKDIQTNLGPSHIEQPIQEKNDRYIYCKHCENVPLWLPALPPNTYHLPVIMWFQQIVVPRMYHNERCFVCVLTYILNSPQFTIVDQILAEKFIHSVPDLINSHIIHLEKEQKQEPTQQPKEEYTQPTESSNEPKSIRDILQQFKKYEENQ